MSKWIVMEEGVKYKLDLGGSGWLYIKKWVENYWVVSGEVLEIDFPTMMICVPCDSQDPLESAKKLSIECVKQLFFRAINMLNNAGKDLEKDESETGDE